MNKDFVVAIDGYSSTGKSSLAKALAQRLGFVHIDSGAMYRAVTLYALQHGFIHNGEVNTQELVRALPNIHIHFEYNPKTQTNEVYLNGKNVEKQIRGMEVSSNVSNVAKIPEVRKYLVQLQRKLAKNHGVVMDGRDIGTTVFPDAEVKIFLTAGVEERAKRRYLELKEKGKNVTLQEVKKNIADRDFTDEHRSTSPLAKAPDAVVIDNGNLTKEETLEKAWQVITEKYPNLESKGE